MDKAIVTGEYITFKHVKTRKVVILEVEVPEEHFQHVINTLGMPIGGESKPVAVALLDKSIVTKPQINCDREQTEGKKLRTRAVLLCEDDNFVEYCNNQLKSPYDLKTLGIDARNQIAAERIYKQCGITSRSELATNIDAQIKFKELEFEYRTWKLENQYADNLSRV